MSPAESTSVRPLRRRARPSGSAGAVSPRARPVRGSARRRRRRRAPSRPSRRCAQRPSGRRRRRSTSTCHAAVVDVSDRAAVADGRAVGRAREHDGAQRARSIRGATVLARPGRRRRRTGSSPARRPPSACCASATKTPCRSPVLSGGALSHASSPAPRFAVARIVPSSPTAHADVAGEVHAAQRGRRRRARAPGASTSVPFQPSTVPAAPTAHASSRRRRARRGGRR